MSNIGVNLQAHDDTDFILSVTANHEEYDLQDNVTTTAETPVYVKVMINAQADDVTLTTVDVSGD